MSRSLNKVQLIGNLTRDPELRYTPSGTAVCTIGLATNRSWTDSSGQKQEEVEFHRLVVWAKLAEICAQYLKKGRQVYFEGRLQTRKWTGQDGVERQTTEIVVSDMLMLSGGGGPSGGYQDDSYPGEEDQSAGQSGSGSQAMDDNQDKDKKEEQKKAPEKLEKSDKKSDKKKEEEVKVEADDIPF